MSTLGQDQERFAGYVALAINFAQGRGYGVRMQEVARTEYQAIENVRLGVGVLDSAHRNKLAIDFALTLDGRILAATHSYKFLGDFWKALDSRNRWGGDFPKPDGGHFSILKWGAA